LDQRFRTVPFEGAFQIFNRRNLRGAQAGFVQCRQMLQPLPKRDVLFDPFGRGFRFQEMEDGSGARLGIAVVGEARNGSGAFIL
jgi:hypothetical protein